MNILKYLKEFFIFLLVLFLLFIGFIFWAKSMPGSSFSGNTPSLTESQSLLSKKYENQILYLAKSPRNIKYKDHFNDVQKFILDEFKAENIKVNIQQYTLNNTDFSNFEVTIPNEKDIRLDNKEVIIIGAHYDTFLDSPGADDNGTGVVILMELAKRFAKKFDSNKYVLKFVLFTNEEPPYFNTKDMGSAIYAFKAKEANININGMYSLEMLGFYSSEEDSQDYPFYLKPFFPEKGNFVAFVSNVHSRDLTKNSINAFRQEAKIPSEGVTAPENYVSGIDFSDNKPFYWFGYKALMITDTAFFRNHNYHKHTDQNNTLNYSKMAQVTDYLELMFRKLYED